MDFFDSPYKTKIIDDSVGSFLESYLELNITCDAGATVVVNRYENNVIVDTINVGVVSSGECVVNLPCFGNWEVEEEITIGQSTITNSENIFVQEVKKYEVDVSQTGGLVGSNFTIGKLVTNLVTIGPSQVLYSYMSGNYHYFVAGTDNTVNIDSNGMALSTKAYVATNNLWPCSFNDSNYYYSGDNIFYECMSDDGVTPKDQVVINSAVPDNRSPGILTFSSIAHRWINVINGLNDRSLNITMILDDGRYELNKYALYSEAYEVSGSNIEAVAYAGLFQPGDFIFYSNNNNQNIIQSYPPADQTTKKLSNLRRTLYTSNERIIDFSFWSIGDVIGRLDAYDVWSVSTSSNRNWTNVGSLSIQSNSSYGDLTGEQLVDYLKHGHLVYCGNKILLVDVVQTLSDNYKFVYTIYELFITISSNNIINLTCTLLGSITDPNNRTRGESMVVGMNDGNLVLASGLNYSHYISGGDSGLWGRAVLTSISINVSSNPQIIEKKYFYELLEEQNNGYMNADVNYAALEVQCCSYLGNNKFIIGHAEYLTTGGPYSPYSSLRTILYSNGHFLNNISI